MINGTHVILYSRDADADRVFFRDVLSFASVDAAEGWLIFKSPPAEIAVLALCGRGLFTMPLAIVALWFVLSRSRRWPEVIGFAPAAGLVLLLLAWANRDYQPPCSSLVVSPALGSASCGGVPPRPLLV